MLARGLDQALKRLGVELIGGADLHAPHRLAAALQKPCGIVQIGAIVKAKAEVLSGEGEVDEEEWIW